MLSPSAWSRSLRASYLRQGTPGGFGLLTVEETAAALDVAPVTVKRDWALARAWLANVFSSKDVEAWMLSTTGESPRPLLDAPFVERDARLSPDGALVAYASEESGRPEVSIQTVDRPPRREVVSVSGGDQPVWSRDATELFFVDPAGFLRAVRATSDREGRPALDTPALLKIPRIGSGHYGTQVRRVARWADLLPRSEQRSAAIGTQRRAWLARNS